MSISTRALIALLIATLLWSASPTIFKFGLAEIPPFSFTFIRFLIASILVSPLIIWRRNETIEGRDMGKFIVFGAILGFHIAALLTAISITSVVNITVMAALGPLFISFGSLIYFHNKTSRRLYLGLILALAGTAIFFIKPDNFDQALNSNALIGNLLVLVSLLAVTVFTIGSKQIVQKYSPLTFMGLVFPLAAITIAPFALSEIYTANWVSRVTTSGLLSVLYAGIFASITAFLLYEWSIKYLKVYKAGIVGFLEPVLGTLIAIVVLGETISNITIVGAILIVSGVALATLHLPHHRHGGHKY